jgi:SAM-dependent methyltransferase
MSSLLSAAWRAGRNRGVGYVWHKALRRIPGQYVASKRALLYSDPRSYWSHRGGEDYFREQEAHPTRSHRLEWVARRVASYRPLSILEVGCGYGKLMAAIRRRISAPIVGLDFSTSQLDLARQHLAPLHSMELIHASGDRLPFADRSFDLVVTSAVILHNEPTLAERIRGEIVRVGRRWAVHNEDTDVTYNRYGYDTAAWYTAAGFEIAECAAIPIVSESERSRSQFCVAKLWRP